MNNLDTEQAQEELVLDNFLLYQLSMLSRRLSDALEARYRPRSGLTRVQWRILVLVGLQSHTTAIALVRRASLDAVAVHRVINQLTAAGLLERSRSTSDRRVKPIRLSSEGRRIYMETVPIARDFETKVLAQLPTDEALALRSAVGRLLELPLGELHQPCTRDSSVSRNDF